VPPLTILVFLAPAHRPHDVDMSRGNRFGFSGVEQEGYHTCWLCIGSWSTLHRITKSLQWRPGTTTLVTMCTDVQDEQDNVRHRTRRARRRRAGQSPVMPPSRSSQARAPLEPPFRSSAGRRGHLWDLPGRHRTVVGAPLGRRLQLSRLPSLITKRLVAAGICHAFLVVTRSSWAHLSGPASTTPPSRSSSGQSRSRCSLTACS
jgi:hypothetical protein